MSSAAHSRARFLLICLFAYFHVASAQTGYVYQLDSEYSGTNFFQGWDFYTGGDPTGGYVTYYSQSAAQLTGLINSSATATYIGVDFKTATNLNGAGRPSVRIATQKSWTHGLFIGDFGHAPGGICGTWPAFWTLGPNWPYTGEIDIMEGVNQLTQNAMSLHSNVNCSIAGDPSTETGTVQGTDCAYYVQYGGNGQGCGVQDSRTTSYGTGFNSAGGGVYAMQWTSQYIRVWFFSRYQIPQDITNLTPNPSSWGLPAADLQGSCNIDSTFQSHKVIFDNTFCGSYAGVPSIWNASTNSCLLQTGYPTCNQFVAAQPAAFQNSYWSINSVRVYQLQAAGANSSNSPYIASLQPTSSSSTASAATAVVPTASLCPVYNFTVVQSGNYLYEIECGYNPPGADLGRPYPSYQVHSFEDCVAGCNYWNDNNGSYTCGGVAFQAPSSCYWKKSITTAPANAQYNGARLIYYGYPQIADNPNSSTGTFTSTFVSTTVTPQIYSNPTVTQSSRALSSASGLTSGLGGGMGGSVAILTSSYAMATSVTASSTLLSAITGPGMTSSLLSSSASASSSSPFVLQSSTSMSVTGIVSSGSSASSTSSIAASSTMTAITGSSTVGLAPTSIATSLAPISTSPRVSSTPLSITTSPSTSSIVQALLTSSQTGHTVFTSSVVQQSTVAQSSSLSSTYMPAPTPPVPTTASYLFSSLASSFGTVSSSVAAPIEIPQTIAIFEYSGCEGSSNAFAGFRLVDSDSQLTPEMCVADCYNDAYAGYAGSAHECYCAADPTVARYFVEQPNSDCGDAPFRKLTRQAGMLLTIYRNTQLVPDPNGALLSSSSVSSSPTAASGGGTVLPTSILGMYPSTSAPVLLSSAATTSSSFSSLVDPLSNSGTVILDPEGGGLGTTEPASPTTPSMSLNSITLRPTAVTTIFIDVCDICEQGMTTATTIITMMHCGCTESVDAGGLTVSVSPPSVPMTTIVKDCKCGENNAPSTTEVTVPCTSQIEEMSSSMASILASAAPDGYAQPIPSAAQPAEATEGGHHNGGAAAPAANAGSGGAGREQNGGQPVEPAKAPAQVSNGAEAATGARTADVPEMTNSLAPEVDMSAGDNGNGRYATTQTIHLQAAETNNVTNNGSLHAPQLESPSATKNSEATAAVEKLVSLMAVALFFVMVVMSLL